MTINFQVNIELPSTDGISVDDGGFRFGFGFKSPKTNTNGANRIPEGGVSSAAQV